MKYDELRSRRVKDLARAGGLEDGGEGKKESGQALAAVWLSSGKSFLERDSFWTSRGVVEV